MKFANKLKILMILLYVVLFSTQAGGGRFLLSRGNLMHRSDLDNQIMYADNTTLNQEIDNQSGKKTSSPLVYTHLSVELEGGKQEINILEIDAGTPGIKIKPILSYDRIFGFENLSCMLARNNAYAGINAGFFYEYGEPAGMVAIDGQLITAPTGRYPVFVLRDGKAELEELNIKLYIDTENGRMPINGINAAGSPGRTIVYTPAYGSENRAKVSNITAVVENGCVKKVYVSQGSEKIPQDGFLITSFDPVPFADSCFPVKEGDKVELVSEPGIDGDLQAYECGSWIVKNGSVVCGDWDEWIGTLNNYDPRSVIGIKNDGKVVLLTVDGRQPGYSQGLTGKGLGNFLKDIGVTDAAMLDGGASTEMIVQGCIVNRPSNEGRERPLGGALGVWMP